MDPPDWINVLGQFTSLDKDRPITSLHVSKFHTLYLRYVTTVKFLPPYFTVPYARRGSSTPEREGMSILSLPRIWDSGVPDLRRLSFLFEPSLEQVSLRSTFESVLL